MTEDELRQIIPNAGQQAGVFAGPLTAAAEEFEINTPLRTAAWIAQIAHESASLQAVSENLNYSAEALTRVFPRYFTLSQAAVYARNPERIACRVYANRMGNGPEESGDGWTFRGAGLIQLTGKQNQREVAEHFGIPITEIGTWLRTPEGAARSAGWFWSKNGLNELADRDDFRSITRKVNGGFNGWEDRLAFYDRAKQVLGA
jgi:putative chitinase